MGVSIGSVPQPVGTPAMLVEFVRGGGFLPENNAFVYSPTADGQKFLIATNASTAPPTVQLILNWGRARK